MSQIILQPMSSKEAQKHMNSTLLNTVDIGVVRKYTDITEQNQIESLYPTGKIHIWGVKNGKNKTNQKKWARINPGDVALFAKEGFFFGTAVVTYKFENAELARELWGVDTEGETWQNIYLLDELKSIHYPYEAFSQLIGYELNYVVQGFNVLNQLKSDIILSAWDLRSSVFREAVSEEEYNLIIDRLHNENDLNRKSTGISRKEQSFLRRTLFAGKRFCKCGICGKVYPIELLVAAHIKKRSDCTIQEMLDFKNIIMPMCKFGCDDLYESGYLLVEEGKIIRNSDKFLTFDTEEYIKKIENIACDYWREETMKYFDAHNKKFKFGD